MSRPIVKIHNAFTDEVIVREMNDAEYAQHQIDLAEAQARKAEEDAKAAARQAILDRLGLTEDEAKLLLG